MLRWIIQQRRWTVNNVSNQIQKSYIRNYNLSQTSSNKRLVICCDGTWQQSDAPVKLRLPGYRQRKLLTITDSHWLPESNVTRLYRGIASTDVRDDGTTIPQVVYYQNGIGSGFKRSYAAGVTGAGLNDNVCEVYIYLATNWVPGDEIFLFGFSRGAYTVRALAGLIDNIGLLPRHEVGKFQEIYNDYTARLQYPEYWNRRWGHLKNWHDIKIKVVGVFDTVGSLGLPDNFLVRRLGLNNRFKFHSTGLSSNIEHAFQALALNEKRRHFSPSLWHIPKSREDGKIGTVLKQCWFPGYHSDIGGGSSSDPEASPDFPFLTLAWMVDLCKPFLAFNDSIRTLVTPKTAAPSIPMVTPGASDSTVDEIYDYELHMPIPDMHGTIDMNDSGYATRRIHNSLKGLFRAAGVKVRTPGQYISAEVASERSRGRSTASSSSFVTNEYIHPSVRMRMMKMDSVRRSGQALWVPRALSGFRLSPNDSSGPSWAKVTTKKSQRSEEESKEDKGAKGSGWKWVKKTKVNGLSKVIEIPEEAISLDGSDLSGLMMSEKDKELFRDEEMSTIVGKIKPRSRWAERFKLI